jgi:serine/threonine protein kinase/Flp pilus assembly protein TadD
MMTLEKLRTEAQTLASYTLSQGFASQSVLSHHLGDYERYLIGGGREGFGILLLHRKILSPQHFQQFQKLTASSSARRKQQAPSISESAARASQSSAIIPAGPAPMSSPRAADESELAHSSVSSRQARVSIPGYTLEDVIGEGGMGLVYRAVTEDHEAFAIKLMKNVSSEKAQRRFARERDVMRRLQHPNIVGIIDSGTCSRGDYIVMELLSGETLKEIMSQSRPPPTQALGILVEVCKGLGFAHSEGVIHRDLKPSNIFITDKNKVKVMDFGLAKDLNRETILTQDSDVLGTLHYLSPEQAKGENKLIGPHSDVFSLGVMMYELLTAQRPFQADTRPGLYVRIATHQPEAPHIKDSTIMKVLSDICMKALSKDPIERYSTASALCNDIERVLAGERFSVASLTTVWRQRLRKRPLLGAFVLSMVLLLVSSPWIVAALKQQRRLQRRETAAAQLEEQLLEVAKKLPKAITNKNRSLTVSLAELMAIEARIESFCKRKDASSRRLKTLTKRPKFTKLRTLALITHAEFLFAKKEFNQSHRCCAAALSAINQESAFFTKTLLLIAQSEYARGQSAEALMTLNRLPPGLRTETASVLAFKAKILEDIGDKRAALKLLDQAIEINHDSGLMAEKARLLASSGERGKSEQLFISLLKKHRKSLPLMLNRAKALAIQGRFKEASALISRAERSAPKDLSIKREKTRLLIIQERLAEAHLVLTRALEAAEQENVRLRVERAQLSLDRGMTADARGDLNEVLDKTRTDEEVALVALAMTRLHVMENNKNKAIKRIQEALQLFPRDARVLKLAIALNRERDNSPLINRLYEVAPRDPWASQEKAGRLLELKEWDQAAALARAMIRRLPKNPRGYLVMARALAQSNPKRSAELYARYSLLRSQRVKSGLGLAGRIHRLLALGAGNATASSSRLLRWIELLEFNDCETLRLLALNTKATADERRELLRQALQSNPSCLMSHIQLALSTSKVSFEPRELLHSARFALGSSHDPVTDQKLHLKKIDAELILMRPREALKTIESCERRHRWKLYKQRIKAAIQLKDDALKKRWLKARSSRDKKFGAILNRIKEHAQFVKRSQVMTDANVVHLRDGREAMREILKMTILNEELRGYRAIFELRASNAFGYILLESRSFMRRAKLSPGYFHSSYDALIWLSKKGLETFIEGSAREFNISTPEKYFCRALFNLVESILDPGKNMEKTRAHARRALSDIELCLYHEPRAKTAYLLRGYAHGLLGHSLQSESDFAHFKGKGGLIGVHYMRMLLAVHGNKREAAMKEVRLLIKHGYPARKLNTNHGAKKIRNRREFQAIVHKTEKK